MDQERVAKGLADALIVGAAGIECCVETAQITLGCKRRWVKAFVRRMYVCFGTQPSRRQRHELTFFIKNDSGFRAWSASTKNLAIHYALNSSAMEPPAFTLARNLPSLPTPGDLAQWLGITISELDWYSDTKRMIRSAQGALCHYHYRWTAKRSGGFRLIESPKAKLCDIQRRILHEILDFVPAHASAHGFRPGYSCLTYVAPHISKQVVLRMDLHNFFNSIPIRRIHTLFKRLGYPDTTARQLAGLCTSRITPSAIAKIPGVNSEFSLSWMERKNLSQPHLPQGAPTSPALANLCALYLDIRLSALASCFDADYTRYADDLAFSGEEKMRRHVHKISQYVAAIAQEEGFKVNFHKTRIMHKSDRQILTGIVINDKTNMHREEYGRLKAILHNCCHFGPQSQNREGHRDFRASLLGRVNYLKRLNPSKGEKLHELFNRIEWLTPSL